jgi:peptidoglycan/xylan/chitin deacetylase (PgdA/CDA1 family)
MWEVLNGDFDQKISKEECLENVINNVTPGGIVVFHDSEKGYSNLRYALPKTLKFLKEKGYSFETIESQLI